MIIAVPAVFIFLINFSVKRGTAEVYFTKRIDPVAVVELFEKIDPGFKGHKIGVKVHFGEDGNEYYLPASLAKNLVLMLKANLVETNVLYKSRRSRTGTHIELAREHGFDYAPIDILDSKKELSIKTPSHKYFEEVKIGGNMDDYDGFVIFSHFKGHGYAGFGGAIKNVSMGFATPAGKRAMHAAFYPLYDEKKCVKCGLCEKECPGEAIKIDPIKIDPVKCIGCGKCVSICPAKVYTVSQNNDKHRIFLEKLVEYAKTVIERKPAVYINVLANISKYCDCSSKAPEPFVPDIGILASKDIVAIEAASHDIVNKAYQCKDAFLKENALSGKRQIEYAEELKMGTSLYRIIDIDEKSKK